MNELTKKLVLACRRYKGTAPMLALEFFISDRVEAGLGALAESRRARREYSEVRNIKWESAAQGIVVYEMAIQRPARWADPPMSTRELLLQEDMTSLKMVLVPAADECLKVVVPCHDLVMQGGRDRVADMLRAARRQMTARADKRGR